MNPLEPSPGLLCKLGSICVHVEEALSSKGHAFDVHAITGALQDQEVVEWLIAMDKLAFLPKKR
jgi:hypothetical protein